MADPWVTAPEADPNPIAWPLGFSADALHRERLEVAAIALRAVASDAVNACFPEGHPARADRQFQAVLAADALIASCGFNARELSLFIGVITSAAAQYLTLAEATSLKEEELTAHAARILTLIHHAAAGTLGLRLGALVGEAAQAGARH